MLSQSQKPGSGQMGRVIYVVFFWSIGKIVQVMWLVFDFFRWRADARQPVSSRQLARAFSRWDPRGGVYCTLPEIGHAQGTLNFFQ